MAIQLRRCARCAVPYDSDRSPASLRLTYCGSLCEQADLGFSIEALLRAEFVVVPTQRPVGVFS